MMVNEIKELNEEIEDLTLHLADMLEATLHFAGVSEDNLDFAVKSYIEILDEVFEDEDGEMGYKEIVRAIDYLKKKKPILFV
jgi:nucleotide-binding universal stress UspA family protein